MQKNQLLSLVLYCSLSFLFQPVVIYAQQDESAPTTEQMKKLSIEELMDVEVISVSKWTNKLSMSASAIQVITREDIRRSGASSIPEVLRLADNLHVAQKNSHSWAISARGFNTDLANKLLVLIDGRTVYTPLFSGVFWDRQDYLLEDIERIEVISGPGGTLWGSNAVNGVINIITRKSAETESLYAEAGGGTWLKDFAGLRWGTNVGSIGSFRIYGKYFERSQAHYSNGEEAADSWYMGQTGFRFDSKLSPKDEVTFQGDYYNGRVGLSTGGTSDAIGGNVLGNWTHTFSENSDFSLLYYYDLTKLVNPVPALEANGLELAPAGTLKDDLHTHNVDFQHRVRFSDQNRLVWGIGYRFTRDKVNNAPALAFIPTELDRNLFNVFVQDEYRLHSNWLFTIGTKVEHNDYTGFEFEPSARLQFTLLDDKTVWVAGSRAVRIPSRVDRHIRLPTPVFSPVVDNLLIGGTKFISETVIAYEAGFRSRLGTSISGAISTFYNIYDHIRSTSPSPPPAAFGLPLFYENNLEGETYGLEMNLSCQIVNWWQIRMGYTLLKEDIRVKDGETDFNNALNETADPENRLTLRSSMNLGKKIQFDFDLRWVDSFVYNSSGVPETVSDYSELQVRLSWQVTTKLEWSVVGQNLLHQQHLEYVISSPNPTEEIQRSVYSKIAFRL